MYRDFILFVSAPDSIRSLNVSAKLINSSRTYFAQDVTSSEALSKSKARKDSAWRFVGSECTPAIESFSGFEDEGNDE